MSLLTKFLNQTCLVEAFEVDALGQPKHNAFGELVFHQPKKVRCRHEISYKDVQVPNGSIIKATSRYFFDSNFEIKTDYRVDGHAVLSVSSYVNQFGKLEGFEVYV